MIDWLNWIKKHQFLFEELVKRDFKKYKRTILGMGWSLLSPLLNLLIMLVVFTTLLQYNWSMFLATSQGIVHLVAKAVRMGM